MVLRARPWLASLRVLLLIGVALFVTSAAHAQQSVTLSWDANPETNISGYTLLYGTSSGVYPTSLTVGKVTTYEITGLASSTTYYFVVKAYNSSNQMSPASNQIAHTTGSTPSPPPPPLPGTVTLTAVSPNVGPKTGGTVITLTGTNFKAGVGVFVAGVRATSVTRVSTTQLRATTPAGAAGGARAVSAVNSDNTGAVLQNAFTYKGNSPKLLTATPSIGSVSGGTELRITGTDITPDVGVRIGDTDATLVTHLDGTSMLAIAPPRSAAGLVDVSLTEAGQAVSTLSGAFRYQTVTSSDDTDGDGLPNVWETQWGLNPDSADGAEGAAGDPDGDGVLNIDEFQNSSHPRGFVKRYFAEGVVNQFFDTRFALANPGTTEARLLLEFLDLDGQTSQHVMLLAPRSRTTVNARQMTALPGKSFATRIESDQVVVADRLMRWEATYYGSHAETAIAEPSTTWYFSEGATSGWYELFYLLQNPTETAANVQIRYLRSQGAPVVRTYTLGPRSRSNVHVNEEGPELDHHEMSAEITSTNGVPIIAERSMYFNRTLPYMGGHGSTGVTAPSKTWFLAEGATGSFFMMFVLIGNPTNLDADVNVTYLLSNGSPIQRTYRVPANSRFNINVNNEPGLHNVNVASRYESTQPIIVERTMWWPGGPATWTEGHNSFGVTSTGTRWALAEGEAGGPQNTSTFVLIANTSPFEGQARVTLLFEDAPEVSRIIGLPASSRVNVPFDGPFAIANGRRFATIVETLGPTPAEIVVERAMYADARSDSWSSGSNAVATRLP